MRNYKTQMEAAKKGIVTPEMEIVAKKEYLDVETLRERVAGGEVAIPCNINHKSISPEGIGAGLRTKINVNLGISGDCKNYDVEMQKVEMSIKYGAEAIMDLSNYGKTNTFRRELIAEGVAFRDRQVGFLKAEGRDAEVFDGGVQVVVQAAAKVDHLEVLDVFLRRLDRAAVGKVTCAVLADDRIALCDVEFRRVHPAVARGEEQTLHLIGQNGAVFFKIFHNRFSFYMPWR